MRVSTFWSCFVFFFLGNLLTPIDTLAQHYFFENYTRSKGLAGNTINHVLQDRRGYIWFATQGGGISKFNGQKFTNFNKENGLACNDVTFIFEDKLQKKWIGTAEGLSYFDGLHFTNYQEKEGIGKSVVYSILNDQSNKLWVATLDSGLRYLDNGKFKALSSVTNRSCYSLCADSSAGFWIGMEHGIAHYCSGKLTDWSTHPFIKDHTFFSSHCDKFGNIWMGSIDGTLLKISATHQIEKIELPKICAQDFLGSICEDKNGVLYIATSHGVFLFRNNQFEQISTANGLSTNATQSIFCDDEDNLWIGLFNAGVDLLYAKNFSLYSFKNGTESVNVTSIFQLKNTNTLLLGAKDGLYFFDLKRVNQFQKINSISALQDIEINGLSEDEEGFIWICATQGVFKISIHNRAIKLIAEFHQNSNIDLICPMQMVHEKNDLHWLATFGSGLFKWQGKNEYSFATKIPSQNILAIYKDYKHQIWIGTSDEGLYEIKENEPEKAKTIAKSVWCFAENEKHNLLIGTAENGILEKVENEWKEYYSSPVLKSNYILGLYPEKESCFVIQEDVLARINQNHLNTIEFYNKHDGFNTKGLNHQAVLAQSECGVWLGSVEGLWLFRNFESAKKSTSRELILENILIAFQEMNWAKNNIAFDPVTNLPVDLKLPYSKNQLSFRVKALTTDNVLYSFALIGQDNQWTKASINNEITYSNIAPGNYIFKAISIKNENQLCKKEISFSFTINPPWWQTWWFKSICLIGFVVLLFLFIKRREQKLKDENFMLEKIVQNRTAQISAQNEKLSRLVDEKEMLMKEIHHRVKNNLQMISSILMLQSNAIKDEKIRDIFVEAQSRVNSIGFIHQKLYQSDILENIQLKPFLNDLAVQIISNFSKNSSEIDLICEIEPISFPLKKSVTLGIILNELITNSLKYACKTKETNRIEIKVKKVIEEENEILIFQYQDLGNEIKDMNSKIISATLGLRLIQMMTIQLKAKLTYSHNKENCFLFYISL
jgi:two-component sensor histidine kinase/ligand-binding sensor domain-containing protein